MPLTNFQQDYKMFWQNTLKCELQIRETRVYIGLESKPNSSSEYLKLGFASIAKI